MPLPAMPGLQQRYRQVPLCDPTMVALAPSAPRVVEVVDTLVLQDQQVMV